MTLRLGMAGIALAVMPSLGLAEPALEEATNEEKAKAFDVDYSIPQTPAFDFLGVSPSDVQHPGTLRDLGVDLANAIGTDGTVHQGFALEVRPTPLVWAPDRQDAIDETLKYRLSRLHVSLGTQKVSASTDPMTMLAVSPVDAALGIRWTVVDRGDPWSDRVFREAVAAKIAACAPTQPPPAANACEPGENCGTASPIPSASVAKDEPEDFTACLGPKLTELRDDYQAEHWNATRFELGAAGGFRLPESKLNGDAFWLGEQLWAAGSLGLGDFGDIAVSLRGSMRKETAAATTTKELSGGARLFLGWDRFHVYGEGVYQLRKDSAGDDHDGDWGLGIEIGVMRKTWVAIGLGNALDDDDDVSVLANLRWAISDEERFERPR